MLPRKSVVISAALLLLLAACSGIPFSKRSPDQARTPMIGAASIIPASHHESNLNRALNEFLGKNSKPLLALLSLLAMWLLVRFYESQRSPSATRFNREQIALFKIALDNLTWIWEQIRPGRKVIRMEEWR